LNTPQRLTFGLIIGTLIIAILIGIAKRSTGPDQPAIITPTTTFPLTFTCAEATTYQSGSICIKTEPGAQLQIKITYCSHHIAQSASLTGIFYADSQGTFQWNWIPDTSCRGDATADVTAHWQGLWKESIASFTVV